MNAHQVAAARRLSNAALSYNIDGNLSFRAEVLEGGEVLFSATNVLGGLRWFERAEDFMCILGPRGGVRRATGSLARYVTK